MHGGVARQVLSHLQDIRELGAGVVEEREWIAHSCLPGFTVASMFFLGNQYDRQGNPFEERRRLGATVCEQDGIFGLLVQIVLENREIALRGFRPLGRRAGSQFFEGRDDAPQIQEGFDEGIRHRQQLRDVDHPAAPVAGVLALEGRFSRSRDAQKADLDWTVFTQGRAKQGIVTGRRRAEL